ncbi:hypothetical protein C0966_00495 [Bacillus methanolicus]|nr:hypothetical protein [Bacillus methanolicus]
MLKKFFLMFLGLAILTACANEKTTKEDETPKAELQQTFTKEDWIRESGIQDDIETTEKPTIEVLHLSGGKTPEIIATYTTIDKNKVQKGVLMAKSYNEENNKWEIFFKEEVPGATRFAIAGPLTIDQNGKRETRLVVEHQQKAGTTSQTEAWLYGYDQNSLQKLQKLKSEYVQSGEVKIEDNLLVFKGKEQQETFHWENEIFRGSPQFFNVRNHLKENCDVLLEYETLGEELHVKGISDHTIRVKPGDTIGIRQSGLVKGTVQIRHNLAEEEDEGQFIITVEDHNREIVFDYENGKQVVKITIQLRTELEKKASKSVYFDHTFSDEIRNGRLKGVPYSIGTLVKLIKDEKGTPDFEENWNGSLVFGYSDHVYGYLQSDQPSIHFISYFPKKEKLYMKDAEKIMGLPAAEGISEMDGHYFQTYIISGGKELWLEGSSESKDDPIKEIRLIQK